MYVRNDGDWEWDEGGLFGAEIDGPSTYTTVVYEAEGDILTLAVDGGWQKHEGKWTIGFGPKRMVYRPFGPVRKSKRDFDEQHPLQGGKSTERTSATQRRATSRQQRDR